MFEVFKTLSLYYFRGFHKDEFMVLAFGSYLVFLVQPLCVVIIILGYSINFWFHVHYSSQKVEKYIVPTLDEFKVELRDIHG